MKTSVTTKRAFTNYSLLILGALTTLSGIILQIHYHLLRKSDLTTIIFLDREQWNTVHLWSAIIFTLVLAYHVYSHAKWYKAYIDQRLRSNYKPTIILTIIAFATVITGLLPLLAKRLVFMIEIHDKIGVILIIIAVLHMTKRAKWYKNTR